MIVQATNEAALLPRRQEAGGEPEIEALEDFASAERCLQVSSTLALLANPKRLKVLCMLTERDRSVEELVRGSGGSFSGISQQLKILTLSGLLERRRQGRNIFYKLREEKVLAILQLLKTLYS